MRVIWRAAIVALWIGVLSWLASRLTHHLLLVSESHGVLRMQGTAERAFGLGAGDPACGASRHPAPLMLGLGLAAAGDGSYRFAYLRAGPSGDLSSLLRADWHETEPGRDGLLSWPSSSLLRCCSCTQPGPARIWTVTTRPRRQLAVCSLASNMPKTDGRAGHNTRLREHEGRHCRGEGERLDPHRRRTRCGRYLFSGQVPVRHPAAERALGQRSLRLRPDRRAAAGHLDGDRRLADASSTADVRDPAALLRGFFDQFSRGELRIWLRRPGDHVVRVRVGRYQPSRRSFPRCPAWPPGRPGGGADPGLAAARLLARRGADGEHRGSRRTMGGEE